MKLLLWIVIARFHFKSVYFSLLGMSVNTSGSRHSLSQVSLSSQPNSSNNGSQSGTKGKSNKSSSKRSNTSTKDDVQSAANLPLEACSLAIPITSSFSKAGGSGKQGFRFSLRRMLYNSPLVVQRRARSLSGGNNLGAGGGNPLPSGSTAGSTGALKKKQSTSSCNYFYFIFMNEKHLIIFIYLHSSIRV